MAYFMIYALCISSISFIDGGILPGNHLRGFADYVENHLGSCSRTNWTCAMIIYGSPYTNLDVISAALITQARNPIPAPHNFPPLFNPGSRLPDIYAKMEPVRHLKRYPKPARRQDVKFVMDYNVLNTATNIITPKQKTLNYYDVTSARAILGEDRVRVYLIHDFADSPATVQMRTLRLEFEKLFKSLNTELKYVIITVDWSKGAQYGASATQLQDDGVYEMAALNTMVVGYMVGTFFGKVKKVRYCDTVMVGVGLGAQVAHFAARLLKQKDEDGKIDQIFGLDPTAHHFQGYDRQYVNSNNTMRHYLNVNDAGKVTVIHTSAINNAKVSVGELKLGQIGASYYSGGIDFYPNGGSYQRVCDVRPSFLCNHNAALKYFIAGLSYFASEPIFKSLQASSYDDFLANRGMFTAGSRKMAHMSLSIALRNPIENGMYFNNYDGVSDGMTGVIQNQVTTVFHPPFNVNLTRPKTFTKYNYEQIADPLTNLLIDGEAQSDCGLFIASTLRDSVRVAHGTLSYKGAFPWSVCIYGREHVHLPMDRDPDNGEYTIPDQRRSDVFIVADDAQSYAEYDNKQYYNADNFAPFDGIGHSLCTGTIIDNRHIITAAHCFTYLANGEDIILAMGGTNCMNPVEVRRLIVEKRRGLCHDDPSDIRHRGECKTNVFLHPLYSDAVDTDPDEVPDLHHPDVAIIRIPGDELIFSPPWLTGSPKRTPFLNPICYKSSASFAAQGNYNRRTPPQYVYVAGYGKKAIQERVIVDENALTLIKLRLGSGYILANNNYSVAKGGVIPGVFYSADDSIDRNGKWSGRDILPGDSGATYFWHVTHNRTGLPDYVATTKVVAIGTVRSGPYEGEHIEDTNYDLNYPTAETIETGEAQKLSDLLAFIADVQQETVNIRAEPADFIPELSLQSKRLLVTVG